MRTPALPARKIRVRGQGDDAQQVELAEFAPGILPFLGLSAYLQLELYEAGTRAVVGAQSLEAKDVLARVAGVALTKQQRFAAEIRRRGKEPHVVMAPYTPVIDRYLERVQANDWHQHVLSVYLVGGLFDGFFASIAGGIRDGYARDAIQILTGESGRDELKALLAAAIAADPTLDDSLALWGRRLVGDTLLVAREVLLLSENRKFVASEVEPVFTELIAEHIRRMDALGLTA
nr:MULTISPECIES: ferritin-like fold-containing protein [unclassified Leucobacter]